MNKVTSGGMWRKIRKLLDEVDLKFFGAVCVVVALIFFWLAIEIAIHRGSL